MPTSKPLPRDHVQLCLDECREMARWYREEQRFALAEQWDLRAAEWQQRLDALDATEDPV